MSNARYVATVATTDPLSAIFTPAQATLWELDVTKGSKRVYYKPVCTGKLEDVAKLAEELNAANEPKAEAVQTEADKEDPEATVGIPTVGEGARQAPHMRPGWEPLWILQELNNSLTLVNEGKINLVAFKNRIAKIEEQMMEDIPK